MRATVRLTRFVVAVALLAPGVAAAQPADEREPVRIPPDGTDVFRALLDRAGIKPVTAGELFSEQGQWFGDVIVIVVGNPNTQFSRIDPRGLIQAAIEQGGAVLIAADTGLHLGVAWRANGAVQDQAVIEHVRVRCNDREATHGGRPYCPYVVPITRDNSRFGPPPSSAVAKLFGGDERLGLRPLTRVATNEPACLRISGPSGQFRYTLAGFPPGSVIPGDAYFAVGGEGPDDNYAMRYRFVAMADHSVFINQMLLEPGTDNLELTYRVIDYLQQPSARKRCLFVENGQVVERFDGLRQAFKQGMPIPQVNLWAIQDKLVDLGNTIIDDVQSRDVPNNILMRGFGLPAIMRFFLLLLTALAVGLLLRRLWTGRKPTDIPPAPAVPGAPSGPPGVFDRRQKELLRRNNVYEPVRDLLREFFASIGTPDDAGPKHPKLLIADVVRKPESLRKAVKDFWKLAYGKPEVLTVGRWREMEPYFDRLRQAHADGKWRFVLEEAAAAP